MACISITTWWHEPCRGMIDVYWMQHKLALVSLLSTNVLNILSNTITLRIYAKVNMSYYVVNSYCSFVSKFLKRPVVALTKIWLF